MLCFEQSSNSFFNNIYHRHAYVSFANIVHQTRSVVLLVFLVCSSVAASFFLNFFEFLKTKILLCCPLLPPRFVLLPPSRFRPSFETKFVVLCHFKFRFSLESSLLRHPFPCSFGHRPMLGICAPLVVRSERQAEWVAMAVNRRRRADFFFPLVGWPANRLST